MVILNIFYYILFFTFKSEEFSINDQDKFLNTIFFPNLAF